LQTTIATILQEPVGFQVLHSLVLEGLIEYLQQNACCQQGPNRKEKINDTDDPCFIPAWRVQGAFPRQHTCSS
jgi:hypothetical protein